MLRILLVSSREDSLSDLASALAELGDVDLVRAGSGEKAIALANIISQRNHEKDIEIISDNNQVIVKGQDEYRFESTKNIKKHIIISSPGKYVIND